MKNIFIGFLILASCGQSTHHHGVRRDNKRELKIAAEAARRYADGNFEITMYGDTALVLKDTIIYTYEKPLPENQWSKTHPMEPGIWYWAAPIGYKIWISDYHWTVIKDTAFKEDGVFAMMDTANMFKLEKLGVVKRDCVCQ